MDETRSPEEPTEVTKAVLDALRSASPEERDLFYLLSMLIQEGDPKLIRAVEVNLRSLVKQTRRSEIPWANRRPGNFDPPDD